VLIVIANQDFFYREYHDPREELERAGIKVEVAAGRKEACRPHGNSGQQGNGEVMPDLALSDVDASKYDAIMFSGGWGSSMYQYAFQGSYQNRAYNGDRQTKATVNRLLNQFVAQDKYIGALCHGVSVLAWARVDGKSLLAGRRSVGSPRQSPPGTYNGQRGQPLSRWNVEVNGARLTPLRSIGNPRTSADDVLVDGKLITGEDDNSARLFGQTLARLLTSEKE
jgi:putative intracellular protease/amidase